MGEQTLREALEKNISEDLEPPPTDVAGEPGHEPPPADAPPADAPPAGEPPAPGEKGPTAPIQEPPKVETPEPRERATTTDGRPVAPSLRAPQSWRPEVREHWGKVPLEVQQEITRREQHVMRALNEASKYVQHHQEFQQLCAPYSNMIAMDGGNPLNTFKEYLQTSALLRLGAPQEKANAVANAIMQFGVDIQQLDTALAQRVNGKQPQQPQQQQPQFRDPRLDGLLNDLSLRRQQADDELTRAQQAEIDQFTADPKHEFFEDLRPMVADILEIYANQGIKCTLQDAYDKACTLHPEISKIVMARNTAAAANSLVRRNNDTIAAKRRAASLPPGVPNIAPGDSSELSLRDTLSAAIDQASSRA